MHLELEGKGIVSEGEMEGRWMEGRKKGRVTCVVEMFSLSLDSLVDELAFDRVVQGVSKILARYVDVLLCGSADRFEKIEDLFAVLNALFGVDVGYMASFGVVCIEY